MTWTINLAVKDGQVDAEATRIVGTPPDGPITVNGHENDQGHGINVTACGMQAYVYAPKTPATEPAAPGSELDAELLAREAYAAYGVAVGGLNHRDEPMPAWQDLGEKIQEAWRRASTAAAERAGR